MTKSKSKSTTLFDKDKFVSKKIHKLTLNLSDTKLVMYDSNLANSYENSKI